MKSQQLLPAHPVTIRPYVLIKEVAGMQGCAEVSPLLSSPGKLHILQGGAGP